MYYFIVNPGSRSGLGKHVWESVERELKQEQTEYRVFFTARRYHATEIAQEITSSGKKLTLIALGGDGTVNEVINGIRDFSKVTFAYIPTGSSNDFARSLRLPSEPKEALHNILRPSYYRRLDLGFVDFPDRPWYFAVSCGCGFDAAVCHEALHSRIKGVLNRLHLGKLTYVWIALKQLFLFRPFALDIRTDDGNTLSYRNTYFMSIMNCCYEGGGLKLCPKARTDDGLLDPCVIAGVSRLKIAFLFPTAFKGRHTRIKGVRMLRAKALEIRTETPVLFHTDGETTEIQGRLKISCIPGALTMIAGKC